MILGYFDYIIIGILIFMNIKFWKKQTHQKIVSIVGALLFVIILPITSMFIEIQRVEMNIGIVDDFEVLYTYFRFPMYWILGIIQVIISGFKLNSVTAKQQDVG